MEAVDSNYNENIQELGNSIANILHSWTRMFENYDQYIIPQNWNNGSWRFYKDKHEFEAWISKCFFKPQGLLFWVKDCNCQSLDIKFVNVKEMQGDSLAGYLGVLEYVAEKAVFSALETLKQT